MVVFFLFKQKTAYEMRISDWSSDVCSSDLMIGPPAAQGARTRSAIARASALLTDASAGCRAHAAWVERMNRRMSGSRSSPVPAASAAIDPGIWGIADRHSLENAPEKVARSEEHTSELQSLMRISYAVFC